MEEATSEPCFTGCNTCGVCPQFGVTPVFMKPSEMAQFVPKRVTVKSKAEQFPMPSFKARLMLQKKGELRFISHLDWLRMLQRAIIRAKLPIAYSQGFNPSQRMSFGAALPMFTEGLEEYLDLDMVDQPSDLMARLNRHLPLDGQVLRCDWIPLQSSSLDKSVRYFIYSGRRTCSFPESEYTLTRKVDELLALPDWFVEIERKSTRQRIDIKPFISDIRFNSSDEIVFRVSVDRQVPIVKPIWFLNLIDPNAAWDVMRLKVGLNEDSNFVKVH